MSLYNWNNGEIKPTEEITTDKIVSYIESIYSTPNPIFANVIRTLADRNVYTRYLVVSAGYTNDMLNNMAKSSDLSSTLGLISGYSVRTYNDDSGNQTGTFIDVFCDSITSEILNTYASTDLSSYNSKLNYVDGSELIGFKNVTSSKTTVRDALINLEYKRFVSIDDASDMDDLTGDKYYKISNDLTLPDATECFCTITFLNISTESITLTPYNSQMINVDDESVSLSKNARLKLISDGENWWTL